MHTRFLVLDLFTPDDISPLPQPSSSTQKKKMHPCAKHEMNPYCLSLRYPDTLLMMHNCVSHNALLSRTAEHKCKPLTAALLCLPTSLVQLYLKKPPSTTMRQVCYILTSLLVRNNGTAKPFTLNFITGGCCHESCSIQRYFTWSLAIGIAQYCLAKHTCSRPWHINLQDNHRSTARHNWPLTNKISDNQIYMDKW